MGSGSRSVRPGPGPGPGRRRLRRSRSGRRGVGAAALGYPYTVRVESAAEAASGKGLLTPGKTVASIRRTPRTILLVELRRRRGHVLYEPVYALIDGATGAQAVLESGLTFRRGFAGLAGLGSRHLVFLKSMKQRGDTDLASVLRLTRTSRSVGLRIASVLVRRRLIKKRGPEAYSRVVPLPKPFIAPEPPALEPVKIRGKPRLKPPLILAGIRLLVSTLWGEYVVSGVQPFFYPVYAAAVIDRGDIRHVYVDGRTGERIRLPN